MLLQNGFHPIVLKQQFCLAQTMKFSSAPLHKTTHRITLFVKKMLAELAHNQDLKMHCFSHFFTCITDYTVNVLSAESTDECLRTKSKETSSDFNR